MKIFMLSPNFLEPRSWMASAYKTALLLQKSGAKVTVITSKTKGSKAFEVMDGVNVYRKPCIFIPDPFNYTIIPFYFFHVWKLMRKIKPDVFIVNKNMFYTSLIVIPLKLMRKKVIMQTDTFPGICWFKESWWYNVLLVLFARTIGWVNLLFADIVVILHEGLVQPAKSLFLKHKVIHSGVDLKKYQVKGAKDILKLKGKKKLVTYVGRLDVVKGVDELLKVAKSMEERKDVHFLFVCGDKDEEKRIPLRKIHKNATFLGFRKDIPEIMNASDVFVNPAVSEGLPNTVMEAMASHCACVATAVGGTPSLIKNNESGFLIPPRDPKILKKKIEILLKDAKLRKKFGKAAYEKIKKEYSWDVIEKEWKKLLKY